MTLQNRWHRISWLSALGAVAALLLWLSAARWPVHGQGGNAVVVVSAASFSAAVAPDSIAAAFGSRLATHTAAATGASLPTALAGTSVRINGELAPLFFVSPEQVNFLIPAGVPAGTASVVITAADGTIAQGTAQVVPVAPALFAANGNGQGALAALLLRIKANGQQLFEPLAQFDQTGGRFVTRPLEFGAESDQLFLILFLTGLRQAPPSSVRVNLGGVEFAPLYAGRQGDLAGLDQVNLALPRSFGGRGRITLFVRAGGAGASNAGEFEIGAGTQTAGNNAPMQINAPAQAVLAGTELEISGAGFAANPNENTVQIVADDGVTTKAEVLAVGSAALRIRVPFGAGTGQLKVSRGQLEASAALSVRTSVSGFVERFEQGRRVPLPNARVRLVGRPESEIVTNENGSFVLPDAPAAARADFEILPPADGALNFPNKKFALRVRANRDNQLARGDEQTLIGMAQFPLPAEADSANAAAPAAEPAASLTFLAPGRTPANLPTGHFSSRIAQIAPFGQAIAPARLSFENADALPAGAPARLFKFDQTNGSATLGQFVEVGTATVSTDGQRVETAANAITEGSYYFVSITRPLAAINGRVLESDGRPVPRAIVQARGQATFTDGFGGFVLREVPVLRASGDRVRVEVSYQRPDGRIVRRDDSEVELIAGALSTLKADLVLEAPATNLPPVLLVPASLTLTEGEPRNFEVSSFDPDSAAPPQLALAGTAAGFAAITPMGAQLFRLSLSPNAPGNFTLDLMATDGAGGRAMQSSAITVNARSNAPVAETQAVVTGEDTPRAITLAGRGTGALSYAILSGPARGSLSGTAPNLVYTPARDFNGADSFTFRVSSGGAQSNPATVFIAVSPVNDAPVLALPGAQTVNAGEPLNLIVAATDVDGDRGLRITATGLPPGATLTEAGGANRQLSWTPTFAQEGNHTLSFTASDSGAPPLSQARTLTVRVVARWARTSGPEGGWVMSLANAGPILFAGTRNGGVYRSTDGGQSWTRTGKGLETLDVTVLLVNGGNLYAGTFYGGVYRSTNGGLNWTRTSNGLTDNAVTVFALLPSGDSLYAGTAGGVYRSTDGGLNWVRASNGLTGQALWVDALLRDGNHLYAGTNDGVYRSTDGLNWARTSSGLTGQALFVNALLRDGNHLYAGTNDGVYRSSDGGQNWGPTPVRDDVHALAASGGTLYAGTFYAGVYRSADNGQNWTPVNNGLGGSFPALLASGGQLYAATTNSVYRLAAGSAEWTRAATGINASDVLDLLEFDNAVYAATRSGVYRSRDGGQSWDERSERLAGEDVFDLLAHEGQLYAATIAAVYRSANGGESWELASDGLPLRLVTALAASGSTLYAGTLGNGVYRSTNGGQSWTRASNGLTDDALDINALLTSGNSLYAGTDDGVFRSSDGGQNWVNSSSGLGRVGQGVEVLLANGGSLYAGTFDGIYRSTNGGQSWGFLSDVLGDDLAGVRKLYAGGGSLYAAVEVFREVQADFSIGMGDGVYRSTDGGQSWTRLGTGLFNPTVGALVLSGAKLFAGTDGDGVYVLADAEQSWGEANGNLPTKFTNTLALSGDTLFIGTLGGGVFRSVDQGQSWTAVNAGLPPNANLQSLVTNGAMLWAATFGDGVYASLNQGTSWMPVNAGLGNRFVNQLFLNGATLYAGTDGGVFRSSDGGASWTALGAGLGNRRVLAFGLNAGTLYAGTDGGVFRLAGDVWTAAGLGNLAVRVLGVSGAALYAGTLGGGVFRSRDGGATWTPVNTNLPPTLNVYAFAVSGRKVYAGSIQGLFLSEDAGQTWKQLNAGLLNTFVTGLAVSGEQLFAATASGGVFVSRIP